MPSSVHEYFVLCANKSALKWTQTCQLHLNPMEQHTFKNINNCLNTNIYSYLQTSGGQSSNPYLNVVHFFNNRVN
jgi:hypothetical protein